MIMPYVNNKDADHPAHPQPHKMLLQILTLSNHPWLIFCKCIGISIFDRKIQDIFFWVGWGVGCIYFFIQINSFIFSLAFCFYSNSFSSLDKVGTLIEPHHEKTCLCHMQTTKVHCASMQSDQHLCCLLPR